MRALILSSLFAIGVGLAGVGSASAAPLAPISAAQLGGASTSSMLLDVQYYRGRPRCRSVRVCRWTPYGRRCRTERVCRGRW